MLPPQMRDPIAGVPGFGNPNARQPDGRASTIRTRRARSLFASMDMQADLREIYDDGEPQQRGDLRASIRAGSPIPSSASTDNIDAADRPRVPATRRWTRCAPLADNTDGRAIVNRNDLAGGMKQIVRDTSAYYLLGYNSTQAPTDGKFHEIKVRVKRPGVQVRARKGYWALNAEETDARDGSAQAGPAPKPLTAALAPINAPPQSRVIRTLDRHLARRERQDQSHLRLGARAEGAGRPAGGRQRAAGPRCADGGRRRRLAVFPRPRAGYCVGVRGTVDGRRRRQRERRAAEAVARQLRGEARARCSCGCRSKAPDPKCSIRRCAKSRYPISRSPQTTLGTPRVVPGADRARVCSSSRRDATAVPIAGREFSRTDRLLIRVPALMAQAPRSRRSPRAC